MPDIDIPALLADSDSIGTIIIIVIVAVVSLIQKLVEKFKNSNEAPRHDSGRDWDPDEDSHERQIREIIKSLGGNPSEQEPTMRKAHFPEPTPAKLKPKAAPGRHAGHHASAQTVIQQPAPQTVTQQAASSMQQAEQHSVQDAAAQSLGSLSDAELAALERLKQKAPVEDRQISTPRLKPRHSAGLNSSNLREGLAVNETLRAAILYHEILGKPVALRDI